MTPNEIADLRLIYHNWKITDYPEVKRASAVQLLDAIPTLLDALEAAPQPPAQSRTPETFRGHSLQDLQHRASMIQELSEVSGVPTLAALVGWLALILEEHLAADARS